MKPINVRPIKRKKNMPIIIITGKERLAFKIADDDETTIWYRRLPPTKRSELVQKHTVMGEINNLACQIDMVQYCVLGWEGMLDSEGNDVPYTKESIENLPTPIILRLMDRVNESSPVDIINNLKKRQNGASSFKA